LLLQWSPATIDRLLAPARFAQGGQQRLQCLRRVTKADNGGGYVSSSLAAMAGWGDDPFKGLQIR